MTTTAHGHPSEGAYRPHVDPSEPGHGPATVTDHHGRSWERIGRNLYRHDSLAWTLEMIQDTTHGLPSPEALANPNYELCAICRAGASAAVESITVSLVVENSYELYEDVTTTFTDVTMPAPPADRDSETYEDWAYTHIFCEYTGVGHTAGKSWYDVEVTACSDPTLIGVTFAWGY